MRSAVRSGRAGLENSLWKVSVRLARAKVLCGNAWVAGGGESSSWTELLNSLAAAALRALLSLTGFVAADRSSVVEGFWVAA